MRAIFGPIVLFLLTFGAPIWSASQAPAGQPPTAAQGLGQRRPDFDRMLQQQAETDKTWREAAAGFMQVEKITYRSRAGDLEIPQWRFQPLKMHGPKLHATCVRTHEEHPRAPLRAFHPIIRGHRHEGHHRHRAGYRGSIGAATVLRRDYGKEVDDVVTAVDVLRPNTAVDPAHRHHGWAAG
jgi:hypothetical protein